MRQSVQDLDTSANELHRSPQPGILLLHPPGLRTDCVVQPFFARYCIFGMSAFFSSEESAFVAAAATQTCGGRPFEGSVVIRMSHLSRERALRALGVKRG